MQESGSRQAVGIVLACVILLPTRALAICPGLNDCFVGNNCDQYLGDGSTCTLDACSPGGTGVCQTRFGNRQCVPLPGNSSACTAPQCRTPVCPLPPGCNRPSECRQQGTCSSVSAPAGTSCNDSNACTSVDICIGSNDICAGTPIAGCQQCSTPADCDDGNPCTTDTCPFGACQHGPAAGVVCRPAAGACDVAETCPAGSTVCPQDGFAPSSTVCRKSAGVCDVAETCTGTSAECPPDGFAPSSTVCRRTTGVCDVAETCSGRDAQCPSDQVLPAGASCPSDGDPCTADSCDGSGKNCTHALRPDCRPCTTAAQCDDGNPCTVDACELGSCRSRPGNAGLTCRPAQGQCDLAEVCPGDSAICPPDQVSPTGTVCRPAAGACDNPEACDGVSPACPTDRLKPASSVCRPATDACDQAGTCDGTSLTCPPDSRKPENTPCDDGDPKTGTSSCDAAGQCTGVEVQVNVVPPPPIPPGQSAAQVRIRIDVDVPDTSGPKSARVVLQGVVQCSDLPPNLRPKRCAAPASLIVTNASQGNSVFVPVTPRVARQLGKRRKRAAGIDLGLNGRGRKAFDAQGQLPVKLNTDVRDRQGTTVAAVFDALLARQH